MSDAAIVLLVVLSLVSVGAAGASLWLWRKASGQNMARDLERLMNEVQTHLVDRLAATQQSLSGTLQESLQAARFEQRDALGHAVKALEDKFIGLQGQVDSKLAQTVQANRQDLARVSDGLGKLNQATGQIVTLSQGVSDLNTLLRAPNLRGSFGEWTLEHMLKQVLGPEGGTYHQQFVLAGGQRADAAVHTRPGGSQIMCIDAKFPATQARLLLDPALDEAARVTRMRQFHRDVTGHARDISEKYIRPPETTGYALMFVPSEAVFQLILQETALHEKLLEMNVVPTSPNSLYAYLQVVVFALRHVRIHEQALEIQRQVGGMSHAFTALRRNFGTLGTHLRNAGSKYEETATDVERFGQKLNRIQHAGDAEEAEPQVESGDPALFDPAPPEKAA